jgi:hypothetical protein
MAEGQANIEDTSKATVESDGADIANADTLSFISFRVISWFRDP